MNIHGNQPTRRIGARHIHDALRADADLFRLLQQQARYGVALPETVEVVTERKRSADRVRLQVFFQSVDPGCSCADDPSAPTTLTEVAWLEARLDGDDIRFTPTTENETAEGSSE